MLPPIISTTPNSPTVCAKLSTGRLHDAAARQRQHHVEEAVQRTGAQHGRRFQRPAPHALERGLQRLHREGQRIEHRPEQQAAEGEGQQAQAQRLRQLPAPARGPKATSR
jgi:hypothetical protein